MGEEVWVGAPLSSNKEADVKYIHMLVFGPRQEIIVNNGGMGMGGGTTIIE